jgi:hypothetical protein
MSIKTGLTLVTPHESKRDYRNTYEKSLEFGLQEALKLINNDKSR